MQISMGFSLRTQADHVRCLLRKASHIYTGTLWALLWKCMCVNLAAFWLCLRHFMFSSSWRLKMMISDVLQDISSPQTPPRPPPRPCLDDVIKAKTNQLWHWGGEVSVLWFSQNAFLGFYRSFISVCALMWNQGIAESRSALPQNFRFDVLVQKAMKKPFLVMISNELGLWYLNHI